MSEHNKYGNGVKRNLEIFRDDFQRISELDYEEIPEIYVGYNVLVSYLKTQKNKSYRKFLFRNRKTIVDSLLSLVSSLDWLYFDNYWVDHFLKESENLNKSTFVSLKEKVNTERTRYTKNLETYWIGVIKECELRRELSKNEDKKEYVLQTLHDIDEKIQTIREQIAELNNEWNHNHKEEGSLMSINDNPEIQLDDYDPGKDWRVQRRKDKSKAIKNINNDVEIREANSFGIPNDHVFESVPSLITSSSTLSNNNSRSGTLNQVSHPKFFDDNISYIDSDEDDPEIQERLKELRKKYMKGNSHRKYKPNPRIRQKHAGVGFNTDTPQKEILQDDMIKLPNKNQIDDTSDICIEPSYLPVSRASLRLAEIHQMETQYYLDLTTPHNTSPELHHLFSRKRQKLSPMLSPSQISSNLLDSSLQNLNTSSTSNFDENEKPNLTKVSPPPYDYIQCDYDNNDQYSYRQDYNGNLGNENEPISPLQSQSNGLGSETVKEIPRSAKYLHKVSFDNVVAKLHALIPNHELACIVKRMEENVQFLEFPDLKDFTFSFSNDQKHQAFLKTVDGLFPTIDLITDESTATKAVKTLDQQLIMGHKIMNITEDMRLEATYTYIYVYRECAKIALKDLSVTGHKKKRSIILNYIIERMMDGDISARRQREYRMHRSALCLRYLSSFINRKVLSQAGITVTHLSTVSNNEWMIFLSEAFSNLAAERMLKWLSLVNSGKIPDVLLKGTAYYREDDGM